MMSVKERINANIETLRTVMNSLFVAVGGASSFLLLNVEKLPPYKSIIMLIACILLFASFAVTVWFLRINLNKLEKL